MRLPVIHAFTVWRKDGVDVSPFTTAEELKVRGLREGEPGTEIIPELAPVENESSRRAPAGRLAEAP
jgi:hypothetical protein